MMPGGSSSCHGWRTWSPSMRTALRRSLWFGWPSTATRSSVPTLPATRRCATSATIPASRYLSRPKGRRTASTTTSSSTGGRGLPWGCARPAAAAGRDVSRARGEVPADARSPTSRQPGDRPPDIPQAIGNAGQPSQPIGSLAMLVAGIRRIGGDVEMIDVPEPRPLAEDEVLMQVRAAGVANWDEIVRTGGWDVGSRPPMALGVEAAGVVAAVGNAVTDFAPGDEVMTHPLPLRDQGTWAPTLIAPAALLAPKPAGVSWEVAAVFPVPALTAEQVLDEALEVKTGDRLLVNGAGGITGGLLVSLGSLRGAEVFATAGPHRHEAVGALGACHVIDYHDDDWPEQILAITRGSGVSAAVNAAPGGAKDAIRAVTDGGRLATITSDPPAEERGIMVSSVYVRPDGGQLRNLTQLLAVGQLKVSVGMTYGLLDAADALAKAVSGRAGGAVALTL